MDSLATASSVTCEEGGFGSEAKEAVRRRGIAHRDKTASAASSQDENLPEGWERLTKAQRWEIADRLATERLPQVNAQSKPVVPSRSLYARHGKRAVDIVLALLALIVTAPINIVAAIVTRFDVGSPILFHQERTGKDGKPFTLVKFRNMTNERDERGELLPPAQRVTKFGRFMRKTSLDELLNFWSVLKGDMSIIGPRPLVPEYSGRLSDRHHARLAVRPGLECPPRSLDSSVRSWDDQFENDVWYVENLSFKTDLLMLWNLVRFALDSTNANARAGAKRGIFMGYDERGHASNEYAVPEEYVREALNEGTE